MKKKKKTLKGLFEKAYNKFPSKDQQGNFFIFSEERLTVHEMGYYSVTKLLGFPILQLSLKINLIKCLILEIDQKEKSR